MNIKKNDTVIVLSGKDKGVKGKVLVAMPSENKVIVEKVNVATCHTKPRRQGETGGTRAAREGLHEDPVSGSRSHLIGGPRNEH